MIIGMTTYGFVHMVLSLLTLISGLAVVAGLLAAMQLKTLTAFYFASAVATTLTGFGFLGHLSIAHLLGGIALGLLLVALLARYAFHLAGAWRAVYAIVAVLSVWSFVFFAIGEAFLRIPMLKATAPKLAELPFWLAQGAGLTLFLALAAAAAFRFRPST